MIKLVFDDVEISVKPENPLFKTLSRFEGESFTVVGDTIEKESVQPTESYQQVEVEAEPYYNLLEASFDEQFIKSPCGTLLRSHLDNIFTSKKVQMSEITKDDLGSRLLMSNREFFVVGLE